MRGTKFVCKKKLEKLHLLHVSKYLTASEAMSLIEIYFVELVAVCSGGSADLTWEIGSTQLYVCLFNDNGSKSESFSIIRTKVQN